MQAFIHYFLHFGFPFFIAIIFFKNDWKRVYLILIATMLVDVDHLFAYPIFEPDRCSINFHIFHSYYAIAVYVVLLFFKRPFNIIGIGLIFHMFTDLIDCMMMYADCSACFSGSPAYDLLQTISELSGIGFK